MNEKLEKHYIGEDRFIFFDEATYAVSKWNEKKNLDGTPAHPMPSIHAPISARKILLRSHYKDAYKEIENALADFKELFRYGDSWVFHDPKLAEFCCNMPFIDERRIDYDTIPTEIQTMLTKITEPDANVPKKPKAAKKTIEFDETANDVKLGAHVSTFSVVHGIFYATLPQSYYDAFLGKLRSISKERNCKYFYWRITSAAKEFKAVVKKNINIVPSQEYQFREAYDQNMVNAAFANLKPPLSNPVVYFDANGERVQDPARSVLMVRDKMVLGVPKPDAALNPVVFIKRSSWSGISAALENGYYITQNDAQVASPTERDVNSYDGTTDELKMFRQ